LLPEHDDESDQEALAVAGCQAFLPGHAFNSRTSFKFFRSLRSREFVNLTNRSCLVLPSSKNSLRKFFRF
jgi:hypothetical protein